MYSLENLKEVFGWLLSSPAAIFVIIGIAFIFCLTIYLKRG